MKYLLLLSTLALSINGCASSGKQIRTSGSMYQYYNPPLRTYYVQQPTSYRIKPYHVMNSGMGF